MVGDFPCLPDIVNLFLNPARGHNARFRFPPLSLRSDWLVSGDGSGAGVSSRFSSKFCPTPDFGTPVVGFLSCFSGPSWILIVQGGRMILATVHGPLPTRSQKPMLGLSAQPHSFCACDVRRLLPAHCSEDGFTRIKSFFWDSLAFFPPCRGDHLSSFSLPLFLFFSRLI